MSALRHLNPAADIDVEELVSLILWSRYDFIRSPEGFALNDRRMVAEHLLGPLSSENDLRYVVEDGDQNFFFCEQLSWDSAFFGYPVARLNAVFRTGAVGDLAAGTRLFLEALRQRGIRYLFAPVFPEDTTVMQALGDAGCALIETRALYHMPLGSYASLERYPVRVATESDIPPLQRTARESVNDYDRFHADPYISLHDADRLMEEWAAASVLRGFADVTLVPDVPVPGAFSTIRYQRERWAQWGYNVGQTVLTAVSPAFQGWHRKLVSETNYHLQSMGVDHTVLPTQITNRAVIHNIEQLGYRYGRAEHIFRMVFT